MWGPSPTVGPGMMGTAVSDMEAVAAMPGMEELTEPIRRLGGGDLHDPAHHVVSIDRLVAESPADVGHCHHGDQGLPAGA